MVIGIIAILLSLAVPALKKNAPRRKLDGYALKALGDLRWAFHRATALGEDLVIEVIGFYENPGSTHPWPLEDTIRIWKRADWDQYRKCSTHKRTFSCSAAAGTPGAFDTLAPYLVFDLSAGSPLDRDGDGLISEDELPVPLREYVREDYRDPPSLLGVAEYQAVLSHPKFHRIRTIPREIDLISPRVDVGNYDGTNYRDTVTYAYIRPTGAGIRSVGILEFAFMLRPEHFGNLSWNKETFECGAKAHFFGKSNGRTVQLLLATGNLRMVSAAPTDYMTLWDATGSPTPIKNHIDSLCDGSVGTVQGSYEFNRGGGWK